MVKVSIITVVYNGVRTLEGTINSVIAQSYPNIEYLIIDGNSDDGTKEIIEKYKEKINFFISEEDEGIYDAMNTGLRKATGDIVCFLNSDDFYSCNNVVSEIVEKFKNNDVDLIYGDILYVSKENINNKIRYWKSLPYSKRFFYYGHQIPHPAVFIKKRVFDQFGVFNTSFRIAADYELLLRFIEKFKVSTLHVPKVIVNMRIGGESNKSILNVIKGNKEIYLSWKINDLKFSPLIFIAKPFIKIRQLIVSKK